MRFNKLLLALLPCALLAQIGGSFLSGDLVRGGSAMTTPGLVPVVSAPGTLGQSDVSLASGIFSRAGTLGLSATGANVITFSTNGSERGRFNDTGFGIGVAPTAALSVNGDLGIAALSKLSLGTTGVGGSQFLKYTAANDGIQIDSYGATIFTGGPSNSEFLRILNTGRVLIGTTTDDGSSKLQVAGGGSGAPTQQVITNTVDAANSDAFLRLNTGTSSPSNGYIAQYNSASGGGARLNVVATQGYLLLGSDQSRIDFYSGGSANMSLASSGILTLYNPTAVTGSTSLVVRAGAGQSSTALQTWQNNAGTAVLNIDPTGVILMPANSTNYAVLQAMSGGADNGNYGLYFNHTDQSVIMYAGTTNVLEARKNKIGFFGVTPAARATALTAADASALTSSDATVIGNMRTRIGELETKLQAYGILN